MGNFIQYEHHGTLVWVDEDLKGTHRDKCLCYSCVNFMPGDEMHCEIANENYKLCIKHNLVLPVFECPAFVEVTDVQEETEADPKA